MGRYGIYVRLELKRAFKMLPRFLTGAIVLVFLLGTIAFLATEALYGNAVANRITIGVVLPKDDIIAEKAITILASLDTVESMCDFVTMAESTAKEQLKNREIDGIMMVHDGFIDDIITGVNTPILLILPERLELESLIFKELADAGARSLGVAQASIYAADEICYLFDMPQAVPQVEAQLNQLFFEYTLPRKDYFRDYKINALGDVTVFQYFCGSSILLCLLLCGIPLYQIGHPDKKALTQKLKLIGIGRDRQIGAKILATATLLILVLSILTAGLAAAKMIELKVVVAVMMVLVSLWSASFIVMVFQVAGNAVTGVISLFWLAVLLLFLSGGIVPAVFLPEVIRSISVLIPTEPVLQILKGFFGVSISWTAAVKVFLWSGVFYLMAVAAGGKR